MKSTIIPKRCNICGKVFPVKIRDDGIILTNCWHNRIDLNYFSGWFYEVNWVDDTDEIETKVKFKKSIYRIIGFCHLTREIIYFFWETFHKRIWFEMWECPKCANREDD